MGKFKKPCALSITVGLAVVLSACAIDSGTAEKKFAEPEYKSGTKTSPRMTIAYNEVISAYEEVGVSAPSRAELDAVSVSVCDDIKDGGEGRFHHPTLANEPEEVLFAETMNYAFATATTCPPKSNFELGNAMSTALSAALDGDSFRYVASFEHWHSEVELEQRKQLELEQQRQLELEAQNETEKPLETRKPDGTYDIDHSQLYLPNYRSKGGSGGGSAVTCADGTTSNSGGSQGACSWHRGID